MHIFIFKIFYNKEIMDDVKNYIIKHLIFTP